MRHHKIADLPLASAPVSLPLVQTGMALDRVTRIVIAAMGIAFVFLAIRIFEQL